MTHAPRTGNAAAVGALAAGAIVLLTLIPFSPDQIRFPPVPLGLLVAAAGLGALALTLAAAVAMRGGRALVPARLEVAALWGACGLSVAGALAAVAATAESLDLANIVLAQRNTAWFVLRQPVGAVVYVVAFALAGDDAALRAVLGPASRARRAADILVVLALGALGATLFLGGYGGPGLPAWAWVAVKTVLLVTVLLLVQRALAGAGHGGRLATAWLLAGAAVVNLALTLALVTR